MNSLLLQASESRFRTVIEANADSIVIVDRHGIIQYANPAAASLFARSQSTLIGAMFGYPVVADETTEIDVVNPYSTTKVAEMRVVEIDWQSEPAYLASLRDITERKQAEDGLRAREHFLAWLNEITRAALETPDFHAMLQIFADRLGELFGADGCRITLWDEERQTAVSGAISHSLADEEPLTEPDTRQKSMTAAVLTSQQALVLEHVAQSAYAAMHTATLFPSQSMLALPLIAGEQKLGAAFVIFLAPHRFTPDEIRQGEQVVSHLSLALAKARSLQAEQEQRELAETLSQVIGVLNSSLDRQQVLNIILAQLAQVVTYDAASVLLLVDGRLQNVAHRSRLASEAGTASQPAHHIPPHMLDVLTRRVPLIRPETAGDPSQPGGIPESHCWLGVPLIVKEKAIGLLSLLKAEPDFYSHKDAAIAAAIVHQATIAIVNAQLYEQIQRYADELETRVAERTQELRQAYSQLQELDRLKSKFRRHFA
ncbi:MAG: GAF domain-containing protein [Chloroflexi bacterium]|nr:GAF domain-containing protein [Chloroflexota bacterium]